MRGEDKSDESGGNSVGIEDNNDGVEDDHKVTYLLL
jgi:hypothetical protein